MCQPPGGRQPSVGYTCRRLINSRTVGQVSIPDRTADVSESLLFLGFIVRATRAKARSSRPYECNAPVPVKNKRPPLREVLTSILENTTLHRAHFPSTPFRLILAVPAAPPSPATSSLARRRVLFEAFQQLVSVNLCRSGGARDGQK